jgi:hypothetical protein
MFQADWGFITLACLLNLALIAIQVVFAKLWYKHKISEIDAKLEKIRNANEPAGLDERPPK